MTVHLSRDSISARAIRASSTIGEVPPKRGARIALSLLAAFFVSLLSGPAWAQSATWLNSPGSADYNTGSNWNTGTVPTATATFGTSNTTSLTSSSITSVGGWTFNGGASNYTFTSSALFSFTGAGITINGGSVAIINSLLLNFNNASTAGSASITNNGGGLDFNNTSTAGSATITNINLGFTALRDSASGGTARFILNGTGALDISGLSTNGTTAGSIEGDGNVSLGSKNLAVGGNNLSTAFTGVIQDGGIFGGSGGSLTKVGTGTLTLSGNNTYSGGSTLAGGIVVAGSNTALGTGTITFNGGTLQSGIGAFTLSNAMQITSAGGTIDAATQVLELDGNITDGAGGPSGTLTFASSAGLGGILLGGTNTYSAKTVVDTNASLIALSTGAFSANSDYTVNSGAALETNSFDSTVRSLSGTGIVSNDNAVSSTLTIALTSGIQTFQGNIIDNIGGGASTLSLIKTGPGTQILAGTNTYSGPTTVNGGLLEVTGSITNSRVTVNNGGALAGTGSVIDTTVNAGGIFLAGDGNPGTSLTVNGNLGLAPGSTYLVSLSPATVSFANVTGTATLGGAVLASFGNGSYISKTYKILTAAGGISGKFSGLANIDLPTNFSDALSYDTNNAYLDLTLNFINPSAPNFTPLNVNQANVANTLVKFFNTNGGIPMQFGTLSSSGLSQVDGEGNTGAEHTAFQLESQFLNAMLDPFIDGRFGHEEAGNISSGNSIQPLGYASEQSIFSPAVSKAYGRVLKGAPPPVVYVPRWNAWGSAYGGVSYSDGNAATGSNQLNANTFGFAAGVDYHISTDTIFGFALGGGGTNWQLSGLSGSGRSQALQTGIYAITRAGPLYGAAAFGFSNNWFTTNRTALGDQLQANFGGQSYGGRIEGGYHVATLPFGITPYGALQVQDFETPNYSENDLTGGGFGLSYASMSATDVRTELGSRFEQATAFGAMPLILRGKLAWAHDFVSNPTLNAAFQALPGTSFIVNGAPIPHNSALTSVGAELFLAPNWSVLAKFDGEFAGTAQTYAGTGTLKYTW